MVKVNEKAKIFLESVTKTVLYVTSTVGSGTPLNSNVESFTLPLILWIHLTNMNSTNVTSDFNENLTLGKNFTFLNLKCLVGRRT